MDGGFLPKTIWKITSACFQSNCQVIDIVAVVMEWEKT